MTSLQIVAAFVTDFADEAVVLPGVLCVGAVFALAGWLRGAAVWLVGVTATLAALLVLKLVFMACGHRFGLMIESPSGHTAAAAVFYGTLLALALRRHFRSLAGQLACVLLAAVVVGTSRLVLGAHTPAEVLIGGAVGSLGAAALLSSIGKPHESRRQVSIMLVPIFVLLCLLHGVRMPAEIAIHRAAVRIWPLSACRTTDLRRAEAHPKGIHDLAGAPRFGHV